MSFKDQFFGAIGTTTGRVVGYVVASVLLLGGGYALYRSLERGPAPDPTGAVEVAPGLPPIFEESTVARPDSVEGWIIEEAPGDFDATLTISLPDGDSDTGPGSDTSGADPGYVSIGLREEIRPLFPELPGRRKLPIEATLIGPLGAKSQGTEARIKAQPQPIIAFDVQAELGCSVFGGSGIQVGGIAGVTGARVFGVRVGAFAAGAPATGGSGARLRAGPYASLRVYGPIGIGIGTDILSAPLSRPEGVTLAITTDLPI